MGVVFNEVPETGGLSGHPGRSCSHPSRLPIHWVDTYEYSPDVTAFLDAVAKRKGRVETYKDAPTRCAKEARVPCGWIDTDALEEVSRIYSLVAFAMMRVQRRSKNRKTCKTLRTDMLVDIHT